MNANILDENKVLPVSLKVLILVTVAIVTSIVYVLINDVKTQNHFSDNDKRISNLEDKQELQGNNLDYLKILMIRIADKLNVDTSNPLDKGNNIKNFSSDLFFNP